MSSSIDSIELEVPSSGLHINVPGQQPALEDRRPSIPIDWSPRSFNLIEEILEKFAHIKDAAMAAEFKIVLEKVKKHCSSHLINIESQRGEKRANTIQEVQTQLKTILAAHPFVDELLHAQMTGMRKKSTAKPKSKLDTCLEPLYSCVRSCVVALNPKIVAVLLLMVAACVKNVAWYQHTDDVEQPFVNAFFQSWGFAGIEYLMMVQGNRLGHDVGMATDQLKFFSEVADWTFYGMYSSIALGHPTEWFHGIGYVLVALGIVSVNWDIIGPWLKDRFPCLLRPNALATRVKKSTNYLSSMRSKIERRQEMLVKAHPPCKAQLADISSPMFDIIDSVLRDLTECDSYLDHAKTMQYFADSGQEIMGDHPVVRFFVGEELDYIAGIISHSKSALYSTTGVFFLCYLALALSGYFASEPFLRASLLLSGAALWKHVAWFFHVPLATLPRPVAVLLSWMLASLEYLPQVYGNRIGVSNGVTLHRLRIVSEAVDWGSFPFFARYGIGQKYMMHNILGIVAMLVAVVFFNFNELS